MYVLIFQIATVLAILLNIVMRARTYVPRVRRAAITLRHVLNVTLGLIFMSYVYPEAITAIQAVNTAAWTFTGNAGAAALWGLTALVGIAGFIQMVAANR